MALVSADGAVEPVPDDAVASADAFVVRRRQVRAAVDTDGTRLRVRSVATKRWKVATLRAGSILVFRGDVAHHGMGVANLNYRIHALGIPLTYNGPRGAIYEAPAD